MKFKTLTFSLMISALFVVTFAMTSFFEMKRLEDLRKESISLSLDLKEINLLKTRWSTQESVHDLESLKNHPNLIKQEKRGGNIYFEYDNLSSNDFNQLSNMILNSVLVIKKLTLRRNSASKGTILVEIES